MPQLSRLQFDDSQAAPLYPRPLIKSAVRVPIPEGFPTFIQPEWDLTGLHPQVFFGSYYLIVGDEGHGRYGSAEAQFVAMHTRLPLPGPPAAIGYVKTGVPVGYRVAEACRVSTFVLDEDGGVKESFIPIDAGTLVLRQPGAEVQHVRPEDELATYFTHPEAEALGLTHMSPEQFAAWAMAQAMQAVRR